ncbi:diacylglycerol kinase family protein [Patescibacteria group bacterium]
MSLKHPTAKSFKYAFSGLKLAFKNEPNLRIHVLIGIIALLFGLIFNLNAVELALLVLTITFVILLELLNTTLEAVVDLASPEVKPTAKLAKDVSAAAVLLSAIASVIIGALLFIPKII